MKRWMVYLAMLGLATLMPQSMFATTPVVKTVPWDPSNFANPHFTYSGKLITLKGTSSQQGANFQFDWDFGDGSPHATGTVSNQYVVQATHTYVGGVGTTWTAVL